MYEGHDLKRTVEYGSTVLDHNPWKTDFERMDPEQRSKWDTGYLPKNNAFHKANLRGKELDLWKGQRYLQDYMATIAAVDEGVGQLLDYLEKNGLAENTLVVYTSDQGFYLGENGWFDKRFMYEPSFGTPLLMQWPGKIDPDIRIDAMVQNLDFAPTFLEVAGVRDSEEEMQGESFMGLLNGSMSEADFRDVIYYHYYDYPAFHMVKKHYGIRTQRYKLLHFYDDIDQWEFYDLEKDPLEKHNAIDDQEYSDRVSIMLRKLDSVQKVYMVTDKEFLKTSKEKVEAAYQQFLELRGTE